MNGWTGPWALIDGRPPWLCGGATELKFAVRVVVGVAFTDVSCVASGLKLLFIGMDPPLICDCISAICIIIYCCCIMNCICSLLMDPFMDSIIYICICCICYTYAT